MAVSAVALSPASIAASTCLTKVRMRLTRLRLIAARRSLRRMRFFACGVFAIVEVPLYAQEKRARSRGRTRSAPPLREAVRKVNYARWQRGQKKVDRPESIRLRIGDPQPQASPSRP